MKKTLTMPWKDVSTSTTEPMMIRSPINIRRTEIGYQRLYSKGDDYCFRSSTQDGKGGVTEHFRTPSFKLEKDVYADHVVRFEIIDEFGCDVGIGFVLGQAKNYVSPDEDKRNG